jgi:transposase-like protein
MKKNGVKSVTKNYKNGVKIEMVLAILEQRANLKAIKYFQQNTHKGMVKAIKQRFPGVIAQRCQFQVIQ